MFILPDLCDTFHAAATGVTCSLGGDKTRRFRRPHWSVPGCAAVTFDLRTPAEREAAALHPRARLENPVLLIRQVWFASGNAVLDVCVLVKVAARTGPGSRRHPHAGAGEAQLRR